MTNQRILLSPPQNNGKEMPYIQQAFETNWLVPLGPHVDAFEKEILKELKAQDRFAVAMNSGTSAIHIALRLLGIKAQEEIFCSDLTFIATANPILYEKARPVFIDSERDTWNLCPKSLLKAIEKKKNNLPRVLISVDLYGMSANYMEIVEICQHYGIELIEDSAEALGSSYRQKACGSFGRFGILSFNGNKIITTSGGGMLVCQKEEDAKKALFLITQARDPAPYYLHSQQGFNYRLSNVCAAIGRGQLETLDLRVKTRRRNYQFYQEAFKNLPLDFLQEEKESFSNCWLSTFTFKPEAMKQGKNPHDLMEFLNSKNIESRRIWRPLHMQPLFEGCEFYQIEDQAVSEDIFNRGLCLPSGAQMTSQELERVALEVKNYFA